MTLAVPLALVLLTAAPSKLSKLEQGQKSFAEGDYAAALKSLDAAAVEGADLEKVQLLRAQCFAAQQDFTHAEEAFALALEANPEASLDPARVDPSVVRVLDGLRQRTRGTVKVTSTPPGAAVTVDGKEAGVAPLDVVAGIGRHKVEAKWAQGTGTAGEVLVRGRRETYLVLVQGAVTNVPVPVDPKKDDKDKDKDTVSMRPFADVRGLVETGGGIYPAMEIGGGIELRYFRAGVHLRLVPEFGVTVRAALVVPVIYGLAAFVEGEVPMIYKNQILAVGLGAVGGFEYHLFKFIGVFAGVGGRHFFENPQFINLDRFELDFGVRLRLP